MSGDRDKDSEAQALIARCLGGGASDADAAALDRLIARDPNAARQLAEAARLESQLEVIMRGPSAPGEAPAARIAPARSWARGARWTAVAATAVAAAAAVALFWAPGRGGGAERAAAPANPPAASAARVRFADGSIADLRDASSKLQTRLSTEAAIELELAQGAARFDVVPRKGRRFLIWVGAAYVEVIGTVFTVERLPAGVRVSVERGVVKVVSGQHETRLSEGTADVVPIQAGEAPPVEAAEAPGPAPRRAQPAPARGVARPEPATDETGALLRASESARRGGHPEDALVFLRRLLDQHPRDPRAPYAAFMLGRVLLEELRRPAEAAAAFARVPALDARTPLVQDALAREVESWARAGEARLARDRARAYLERYPNGSRADEVRRYSRVE
jgi:transmembrane sensor